jgi:signal transduction histidine kinase
VITALKDAGGKLKGFAKVTRDLSERKRAEEDLREAYAGLERRVEERTRELMESKQAAEEAVKIRDRFFSMASHELKTPLSSLKLQTQIRKRKVERGIFDDFVPENLIALCENDERQIERLTFLVDNMLDVSKISAGTFKMVPEELDLCELIDDVIKRLEPILRQSGNETIWRRHEPVPGNWDRHRLEQVFTNLLINAGKYAPGKPVEVTLKNESGLVTAKVCDQGPGIEPESLLRIFSPFERLKEGGHKTGLGLGLYITRQILEAHGGTITVQSRIGEGTIFTVELRQ